MANIDLNAFKERVSVDGDKGNVTVSPNKGEIDSPYRGSPSLVTGVEKKTFENHRKFLSSNYSPNLIFSTLTQSAKLRVTPCRV